MGTANNLNGEGELELEAIRILVVEDEVDDARFALDAIEASGREVTVEVTPYAERALELLSDRTFDCVLLDYRLPRMDGIEFVTQLRDRGIDLPIVVFTGRGSEEIADELFSAGVDAYLDKDEGDDERVRATIEDAIETRGRTA